MTAKRGNMLKPSWRSAVAVLASVVVCSCAQHTLSEQSEVWTRPASSDGKVFQAVIYPFDFSGSTEDDDYVFCLRPCDAAVAEMGSALIVTLTKGQFRGRMGDEPVTVRMKFDGSCFTDSLPCPHYAYQFLEVE